MCTKDETVTSSFVPNHIIYNSSRIRKKKRKKLSNMTVVVISSEMTTQNSFLYRDSRKEKETENIN
uniref:Uncharacterized protein n=1 Tax=Rhizophora mucronata TaxID=61149 RepID=A0A2P2P7L3_RHIMU